MLLAIRPDDPNAIRLHELSLQKAREQKAALDAPATVDAGRPRDAHAQAIDRLRRGDVEADYAALRRDSAARPGYSAASWLSGGAASAALAGGDAKSALTLAETRLADNYLDIGAHEIAFLALKALNRPTEASRHIAIAGGLIRSILGSGDGATQATAWTVISTDEEYAVLGVKRLNRTRQALIDTPGHRYDRLDVNDQQGAASSLWFNIDSYYGKES